MATNWEETRIMKIRFYVREMTLYRSFPLSNSEVYGTSAAGASRQVKILRISVAELWDQQGHVLRWRGIHW